MSPEKAPLRAGLIGLGMMGRHHARVLRGLSGVELVARAPIASFDTGPALCFPHQGQFHALRYLDGLTDAGKRLGVQIYNGTRATRIKGGK